MKHLFAVTVILILLAGCGGAGSMVSAPTVIAIDPPTGTMNAFPRTETVFGTGFVAGPDLAITLTKEGQPDVETNEIHWVSDTVIKCRLEMNMAMGLWNVRVTNGNGDAGIGYNLFMVLSE